MLEPLSAAAILCLSGGWWLVMAPPAGLEPAFPVCAVDANLMLT